MSRGIHRRQFCGAVAASLTPLVAGCRQASLVSPSPSPPIARIADPSVSQAPVSPPIGDIAAPVDLVVIPSAVDREMLMLPIANTPLARVGGVASTEGLLSGIYRYVLLSRSSESRVTALSAICTHEGCIVRRFAAPVFECPCHGSRYDQGGRVVRGPAPAALPELSVEFDGEVARIRF